MNIKQIIIVNAKQIVAIISTYRSSFWSPSLLLASSLFARPSRPKVRTWPTLEKSKNCNTSLSLGTLDCCNEETWLKYRKYISSSS